MLGPTQLGRVPMAELVGRLHALFSALLSSAGRHLLLNMSIKCRNL